MRQEKDPAALQHIHGAIPQIGGYGGYAILQLNDFNTVHTHLGSHLPENAGI